MNKTAENETIMNQIRIAQSKSILWIILMITSSKYQSNKFQTCLRRSWISWQSGG